MSSTDSRIHVGISGERITLTVNGVQALLAPKSARKLATLLNGKADIVELRRDLHM